MISERRVSWRGGSGRVIIRAGELGVELLSSGAEVLVAVVTPPTGDPGALEVDALVVVVTILRGGFGGLEELDAGLDCGWPIVVARLLLGALVNPSGSALDDEEGPYINRHRLGL